MDLQEADAFDAKDMVGNLLTPEWFNENGKAFLYLDEEAEVERQAFLKKYNPDILRNLEGMTLLRTIFLNDDNKDNLCYELEFNSKLIELFGSIKSVQRINMDYTIVKRIRVGPLEADVSHNF